MMIVTTEQIPGYEIRSVLGEVLGINARTHNPYAEGVRFRSYGELNPRMTQSLARWREEAIVRMAAAAQRRGANAVIGMRFDHREIGEYWAEICAYGTAVHVVPIGSPTGDEPDPQRTSQRAAS